jgi:transketolase
MRTAFINQLIEEARSDKSIFLIVGDLGFSVVEPFAEEFSDRFLNAGVAEQNMMGIAAGLALEGYTAFTYSIGNFPTLRCMEQIRYDVCYHNLNVKIVAVGGGYAYGSLGASHHATEELGMLRTIPNLTVCAPGDPVETRAVTSLIINHNGPCYLRLGKAGEPIVHKNEIKIELGKMIPVLEGKGTAILSTGAMLKYSFNYIYNNKLSWGLYSFPFIKPLDLDGLKIIADNYEKIITIEEHQMSGGFGSAILEGYNDLEESDKLLKHPKLKRIAIPDQFVNVAGSQEYLRKLSKILSF